MTKRIFKMKKQKHWSLEAGPTSIFKRRFVGRYTVAKSQLTPHAPSAIFVRIAKSPLEFRSPLLLVRYASRSSVLRWWRYAHTTRCVSPTESYDGQIHCTLTAHWLTALAIHCAALAASMFFSTYRTHSLLCRQSHSNFTLPSIDSLAAIWWFWFPWRVAVALSVEQSKAISSRSVRRTIRPCSVHRTNSATRNRFTAADSAPTTKFTVPYGNRIFHVQIIFASTKWFNGARFRKTLDFFVPR